MMPRKQQGWITFQSSEAERQLLELYCVQAQRSKTEVLRELLRGLEQMLLFPDISNTQEDLDIRELIRKRLKEKAMKVSARNSLKGTIKKVEIGAVNAEITIEISPGVELVSIITKTSAEALGLSAGKEAYAVIKSSDVMIAVE